MTTSSPDSGQGTPQRERLARRWQRDQRGATALEFALTAGPFLLFIFGIMMTGLQFFTMNSLEHGVETAARMIRTGQAQSGGTTLQAFKQAICDSATAPLKCDSHLAVHIQQGANWSDITAEGCLKTDGTNTLAAGTGQSTDSVSTYSGGANVVVLVTVCYQWDLPKVVPIIKIGNMAGGARLLQAAATFRSEPFN